MRYLILLVALLTTLACTPESSACTRTDDMPAGLKMERYRGVTPSCVPGGETLNIPALQQLIKQETPLLIDTYAIMRSVDEGFGSLWLQNKPHYSLPNTVWLPNVGYGTLKSDIEHYLTSNLERLTGGNKNHPLVFFCVQDCWMSWNAVQRVKAYGYTRVYWFRDGTDGWDEVDLPLVEVKPLAVE